MNDLSQGMLNPARFMADEKAAREREDELEVMAEREAAGYFDDCETGDNVEWATYDTDESADALLAVWRVLNMKEEPLERVALAREICRGVMRNAANSNSRQVAANQGKRIMAKFDAAIDALKSEPLPARWGKS